MYLCFDLECFACSVNTDDYYIEEIYFKESGRYLCKTCLEKHVNYLDKDGYHFCCQDYKNVGGDYVHYNMPYIGGEKK